MTATGKPLHLADLEAFDPGAPSRSARRRFWCPLCGQQKPKDAAHRSLSLDVSTGFWRCFRCRAAGRLRDGRGPREHGRSIFGFRAPGEPREPQAAIPEPVASFDWRVAYDRAQPVSGSRAATYLTRRGIPTALAAAALVRVTANWYGRPAVLFPLQNRESDVVAVCGRHTDSGQPKVHTGGRAGQGVFDPFRSVCAERTVVVEAPICALTLACCGLPALALGGTAAPGWLATALAFHEVVLALDADEAGDRASAQLAPRFASLGSRVRRGRPLEAKDWNELLMRGGAEAVRRAAERLGFGHGGHVVAMVLILGGRFASPIQEDDKAW